MCAVCVALVCLNLFALWQHCCRAHFPAGGTDTFARPPTPTCGAQLATGKEVRQLVAPLEAEGEQQGADGRHLEGPPQQVQDAVAAVGRASVP